MHCLETIVKMNNEAQAKYDACQKNIQPICDALDPCIKIIKAAIEVITDELAVAEVRLAAIKILLKKP